MSTLFFLSNPVCEIPKNTFSLRKPPVADSVILTFYLQKDIENNLELFLVPNYIHNKLKNKSNVKSKIRISIKHPGQGFFVKNSL